MQFLFREDFGKMTRNDGLIPVEQAGDLVQRQPCRILFEPDIDSGLFVLRLVDNDRIHRMGPLSEFPPPIHSIILAKLVQHFRTARLRLLGVPRRRDHRNTEIRATEFTEKRERRYLKDNMMKNGCKTRS